MPTDKRAAFRERNVLRVPASVNPASVDVAHVTDKLEARGVRVSSPYNGRTMRLVTHYGIESDDIDLALEAFSRVSA